MTPHALTNVSSKYQHVKVCEILPRLTEGHYDKDKGQMKVRVAVCWSGGRKNWESYM